MSGITSTRLIENGQEGYRWTRMVPIILAPLLLAACQGYAAREPSPPTPRPESATISPATTIPTPTIPTPTTTATTSPPTAQPTPTTVQATLTPVPIASRPAIPTGSVPGRVARIAYGLDLNVHDRNIGIARVPEAFELIWQSGATVVRTGVGWNGLQPADAQHTDWQNLDRLLQLAARDHLSVLLEFGDTPKWDAPSGANPDISYEYAPVDCLNGGSCATVSAFVTALVRHLDASPNRVVVVGLIPRNEPQNFAKNWIGGTAADYARYQHAVYIAVHAVDPRLPVLNGGTEEAPAALQAENARFAKHPRYVAQATQFAHDLYTNPLWCKSIDILDVHVGDHGPIDSPRLVDASEQALQECNGGHAVPVWVTEVGYSYLPAVQEQPAVLAELGTTYSQGAASQAQFLDDTYHALQKDHNVVGINWTFLISPSDVPGVDGAGDGLYSPTWQPKPSLARFRRLVTAPVAE